MTHQRLSVAVLEHIGHDWTPCANVHAGVIASRPTNQWAVRAALAALVTRGVIEGQWHEGRVIAVRQCRVPYLT